MTLTWPFERLDPKAGAVLPYFDYLHNLDLRARAILHARSSEEISVAAQIVILMLDGYYEGSDICQSSTPPANIVRSLQKTGPDVPRYGLSRSLIEMVAEDKTDDWCLATEFNYLKEHIDNFVFDEPGFKNPRQEELFCAYAFLCLQQCQEELEPLNIFSFPNKERLPKKITRDNIVTRFTRAGELALMATEAVCYAERIFETGGLIAGMGRAHGGENIEIKLDSDALAKMAQLALSIKGGKARAAGFDRTKQDVIEYYEKNRKKYKSEAKMIRQMIKDLRLKGIVHSTLERYLRKYRQGNIGITEK